jgi:GxxExxY protein
MSCYTRKRFFNSSACVWRFIASWERGCDEVIYYADFVVWDKILLEAKAVEALADSHIKQVLNYLAASKLRLGLLVNLGGDSLEWKRVVL